MARTTARGELPTLQVGDQIEVLPNHGVLRNWQGCRGQVVGERDGAWDLALVTPLGKRWRGLLNKSVRGAIRKLSLLELMAEAARDD